ncbi:MAG: gtcA [Herbinix sp.]|jgi:putative flippase GtrA|nr:gtcA [Herbinix sp.]
MLIKLYHKYKEPILYVFFGGCTTLVNILVYYIGTRIFSISVMPSTVIAWCFAVLFAYITNRKIVFKSENITLKSVSIELGTFVSCRLFTGAIDLGIMYIFVDLLKINDLFIKIISNIIVILGNYIASRLLIFKNHN